MEIKQKFFIQAVKSLHSWDANNNEFVIEASCFKRNSDSHQVVIDIQEQEIEFTVPNISPEDLKLGHVQQLRDVKEKLKADTHLQIQSLDEQIESLLAIEYKVES